MLGLALAGLGAAAPALADVRPRRAVVAETHARSDAEGTTGRGASAEAPAEAPAAPPEMIAPPQQPEAAATELGVLPGPQAVGVVTELPEPRADGDAAPPPATRRVDRGATSTLAALGLVALAAALVVVVVVARRRR
ncbi:MAG: hypothetical protein R3A79_20110 [Nannocystaceae bacterium]